MDQTPGYDINQLRKELKLGREKPIPYPLQTIEEVAALAERYDKPDVRFMCSFLYLTGQRVSEFLETRAADITMQELDGREILVVNSLTEKNRVQPRRILPIARSGDEKPMVDYCMKYMEKMEPKQRLMEYSRTNCWNLLSSQMVSINIIDLDKTMKATAIRVYPHFLRHCRASHLVMFHNYDIYKLMQFFGWRSLLTPSIYAKMDWRSLAAPMIS